MLERELGSWAAEFILGILQEHEEELEGCRRPSELRYLKKRLRNDMLISKSCHQFAWVNNLSMEYEEDEDTDCETLDEYIAENGKR